MRIYGMWINSTRFKKFWRSYSYMITHPIKSLRLLNFAIHVLHEHRIVPDTDYCFEIDQSCDTCTLWGECDKHTAEIGISPCPDHVMIGESQ